MAENKTTTSDLQIDLIVRGQVRQTFTHHSQIEPYLITCVKDGLCPKESIALNDFEHGELVDEFRGEVHHMVDTLDLKQLYSLRN